jgi:preprotein translocase subunit SecE
MARKEQMAGSSAEGSGAPAAVAEKERPVSDLPIRREAAGEAVPAADYAAAPAGSFFEIYKPGQGYHTRIWSGITLGVMVCWAAYFLYEKLELVGTGATTRYVQVSVAVGTILGLGLFGYWLLARNRRICDFLIATEGEMKKVNWTSRREIIGSTKVVIFVVIFMSLMLFIVDICFMLFFTSIGILKGRGVLEAIQGIF